MEINMQFLIIGPGAMGCLFAARLKNAGFDVTLLDHNTERAELINQQGIMVEGVSGEYTAHVPVTVDGDLTGFDFALVCVKSNRTRFIAETLQGKLSPETFIVTLQNGIGNLEILEDVFGKGRVLGGVTAEGATMLGWGRIKHAGVGATVIGPKRKTDDPCERLANALNKSGFKAETSENVEGLLWGKLVINAGINALTAITRMKNGRLPEIKGTSAIMEDLVNEAVAVSKGKNISLPYEDPLGRVVQVCRNTAGNVSSMLQDVLNKKETEIDFINGAVVREGKALGIPTPVNRTVTALVKAIQESYFERSEVQGVKREE
jgi:2-dehydropantoate 2-reductase